METYELDNQTGVNHAGLFPNMPVKFLTASSIIGDKVLNRAGENMGKIKDIMIDLSSGMIEYVVVEFGGFLKMGEKFFAIPFRLLKVDAKEEAFILEQSKETLEKAPGFDKDHWPETNSHGYRSSSDYWGSFMGPNTGAEPY